MSAAASGRGILVAADEAQLHEAILAGRPQPVGSAPLTWRRGQTVHCPHCGQQWSGINELRMLMRLIDAAR